uniref:Uncharacterized protein n=1 Tax=Anopheles albimanus TaxID=7167 RepID=A0A182FX47_ANOAL
MKRCTTTERVVNEFECRARDLCAVYLGPISVDCASCAFCTSQDTADDRSVRQSAPITKQ